MTSTYLDLTGPQPSPNGRARATRRDLPALLLLFGLLFEIPVPYGLFVQNSSLRTEASLGTISGIVSCAPYITSHGRRGINANVNVVWGADTYQLTQIDGMDYAESVIMSLHAGDSVSARVEHETFGNEINRLWDLRKDGTMILSYQQTRFFLEQRNKQISTACFWSGALGMCLILIASTLKRRLGAWSATKDCNKVEQGTANAKSLQA